MRGSEFSFELIYNVESLDEMKEDFESIAKAIDLLENDYLGGGGSRGNGRVLFKDLATEVVTGDKTLDVPELR